MKNLKKKVDKIEAFLLSILPLETSVEPCLEKQAALFHTVRFHEKEGLLLLFGDGKQTPAELSILFEKKRENNLLFLHPAVAAKSKIVPIFLRG